MTQSFELKDYGKFEIVSKGLLFKLEIKGKTTLFIIPHQNSEQALYKEIENYLKLFEIDEDDIQKIIKSVEEKMPMIQSSIIIKDEKKVPFWSDEDTVYEAIKMGGKNTFLYYENNGYRMKDEIVIDGEIIKPEQYTNPYVIPLDFALNEPPKLTDLYNEVYEIVKDYYYHSDKRVHNFLSLYIIHTYMVSKSIGTIFLWFIGAKRTGKSTIQEISEKLGYRPVSGVGTSEAAIYRILGDKVEYAPLVIIKEYESASELMKQISREGDIPGTPVPRSDKEGDGYRVNFYHIYGSKIVASNRLHGDEADMDRYHIIRAEHGIPNKPRPALHRDKEVVKKINEIRNKLLYWKVANFETFDVPFEDQMIRDGRDWEHYGGIIALAGMISPELKQEMYDYILETINEKTEDEQNSIVVMTAKAILSIAELKKQLIGVDNVKRIRIPFNEIWQKLAEYLTPITDPRTGDIIKLQAPDKLITPQFLGKLIREQLFGHRERPWKEDQVVYKGYSWSIEDLEKLKALVTEVTEVTVFSTVDTKNQDNLKINETDSAKPQNTPKNDGQNPQKTVTTVTSVTTVTDNANDHKTPAALPWFKIKEIYKSEVSQYPEEQQLKHFMINIFENDVKTYTCENCHKVFADLEQAKAHKCSILQEQMV